jgi:cyclic beta-1,2-glucan synthetase
VAWAFAALLASFTAAGPAHPAEPPVRLTDAAEQGTFNVGAARASASRSFDATAGGEVVRLDYTLPPGTAAGAWAKAFPAGLNADTIDVVHLGVKAPGPGQPHQVVAAVEIKGTAGVQRIPLPPQSEWAFREEAVDWPAVGKVTEVVVLVNRAGGSEPAEGTLYVDLRFQRLPWLQKLSTFPAARMGGALLVGLVLALLAALVARGLSSGPWAVGDGQSAGASSLPTAPAAWWRGLKQDVLSGGGAVFTAGLTVAVYLLGERGRLEAGWAALAVAAAGAALAEWWKYGLTGKHLTAREAFQDAFVSGLLAASASPVAILQAPAAWSDLLLLSPLVAAAAALLYHVVNVAHLARTGRHLGAAGAALLVGTPYVVGSLLLLEAEPLVQALGSGLTGGVLAGAPAAAAFVGRVAVLFCFNELAANGLGLATKGTLLRSVRGHLALFAAAVAAVAAPWVAAAGSGAAVASGPAALRPAAAVLATVVSQAALWAEAYLLTGMVLDALRGQPPTGASVRGLAFEGVKKGAVFSGVFMGLLQALGVAADVPAVRGLAEAHPVALAALAGALTFPLLKTIIESFDGSQAFFRRVRASYRKPTLYLRGVVAGLGLGVGIAVALQGRDTATRAWFGFGFGAAVYAGVNLLADAARALTGRGHVQPLRLYFVQGLLGGAVGAGVGFYLDAVQVGVVVAKFQHYLSAGTPPEVYGVYPLLSKWGHINVGLVNGGVSLLFAESLAGILSWSVPAWLFALNRSFMAAFFQKEAGPIMTLFTRQGLAGLVDNMLAVLRWGLWMSPIINSFLRPMGEPTWYNQDGAVRTLIAIVQDARLSPEAFRAWSLQVFIALLAYDAVRILIWVDHMGLRVATLVNLSFLGVDKLEERLARFLGRSATARCIPEGVKRFATWAPLLIPFYIPRGADWDYAWSQAEAIRSGRPEGLGAVLGGLALADWLLLAAGAVVACTALAALLRWLRDRVGVRPLPAWSLANAAYEVTLKANGELVSQGRARGYDVSRRSYDLLDPAGRALFLVDAGPGQRPRAWPVLGNFPVEAGGAARIGGDDTSLTVCHTRNDLRATVTIALPAEDEPVELWTVTVENLTAVARPVKVVPYLEWVLNRPDVDRGHTQYNRLFAQMEYAAGLHAVLAWDQHSKALGLLAADVAPEGFLTARVDFIGRARSLRAPRVLETLAFSEAHDTDAHPTFDPIGCLFLDATLAPGGSARLRLLIGLPASKEQAVELVARHLHLPEAADACHAFAAPSVRGGRPNPEGRESVPPHRIGHGEVPPGTPRPYAEFSEDGRTLLVRTPFTPRPHDHTLSNRRGHIVTVTNRGLHTTASWNSQQNRLTPDWPDTVTRELPAEAFYLFDPATGEWFSPTYHPLNDARAAHAVVFDLGSATFRMTRGTLETELTVFVPPEEPVGVYLLTVRNHAAAARRLRLAPYFQMVLASQPEDAGPLQVRHDAALGALFFINPRNSFRTGPAFAALPCPARHVEIRRGAFFGRGRGVAHPHLVERAEPDAGERHDDRQVAAFLTDLEVPGRGERTVAVLLGQADDRREAEGVIRAYRDPDAARAGLEATRRWWRDLMDTLQVRTADPEFDRYLDWLKYQALAERIWARRGFYQASGAYGFRDQLQDAVNLMWMDPVLARRQLLLHASQQFLEGDVVHWFHLLPDGRTGFAGRTHASDNHLWLAWGVVEYVEATGDESLLWERTPYLEAEQPFEPLPAGKHGAGFVPLRSAREDTVYRHCLRAIDLVLDRRLGAHGLPLIGTGDWNDGLDEIGSQGRGESVWLGFFLYTILDRMAAVVGRHEGPAREEAYRTKLAELGDALQRTWRGDRYLRAFHDDGTEIGVKGSGVWEIDALTAAWAVMAGLDGERGRVVFETALDILEKEEVILLGWPPLREDSKPYLGRSSLYPAGVRENGMYCHGVQWLVGAARILAERCAAAGEADEARRYLDTAYRLWRKVSPLPHVRPEAVETYGGQPNKQAADLVTTFDPGRMIWHGYTGAAGWVFRQALEGVLGLHLRGGEIGHRSELGPAAELGPVRVTRDVTLSPLEGPPVLRPAARSITAGRAEVPAERQPTAMRGGGSQ